MSMCIPLVPGSRRFVLRTAKVPSNRGDEASGFLAGLRALGGAATMDAVVHGTTVGTNALLERKGARLGELLAFSRIKPVAGAESQGTLTL